MTCRVTKITTQSARVELLSVNGIPLPSTSTFQGTIRKEDVRKFDVDSVVIYQCFRPTDTIRAHVISLGIIFL